MSSEESGPWLCHICDATGTGESIVCSHCYKVACAQHVKHVTSFNPETGLYQLMPVCLECALRESMN